MVSPPPLPLHHHPRPLSFPLPSLPPPPSQLFKNVKVILCSKAVQNQTVNTKFGLRVMTFPRIPCLCFFLLAIFHILTLPSPIPISHSFVINSHFSLVFRVESSLPPLLQNPIALLPSTVVVVPLLFFNKYHE